MTEDSRLAKVARDAIYRKEIIKADARAKAQIAQGEVAMANTVRVKVIDFTLDDLASEYDAALTGNAQASAPERARITTEIQRLQAERDKLAPPTPTEAKLPRHIENVKIILK